MEAELEREPKESIILKINKVANEAEKDIDATEAEKDIDATISDEETKQAAQLTHNTAVQNNESEVDNKATNEPTTVIKNEPKQSIISQINKVVATGDEANTGSAIEEETKPSFKILNKQSNAVIIPTLTDLESKIELDDTINEAQKVIEAQKERDKPELVLAPNEVQESLTAYANMLKKQSKNVLGSLVNTVQFSIDGPLIQMLVDSKVKAQQLAGIKEQLLTHLKNQLNENDIHLKIGFIERSKTIETPMKAYSPKERLNEMMEENPAVKDLIEKLDLNFEY